MDAKEMDIKDVTFVVVRNGLILMQLRTSGARRYPDTWVIPGEGKKKKDKTILDIVLRGLREEYGLRCRPENCHMVLQYEHDVQPNGDRDIDAVWVIKLTPRQNPRLKEGKAFEWMSMPKIKQLWQESKDSDKPEPGFEQGLILDQIEMFLFNNGLLH